MTESCASVVPNLSQTSVLPIHPKEKGTKCLNMSSRLNMHIGILYLSDALEYVMPWSSYVLVGEEGLRYVIIAVELYAIKKSLILTWIIETSRIWWLGGSVLHVWPSMR